LPQSSRDYDEIFARRFAARVLEDAQAGQFIAAHNRSDDGDWIYDTLLREWTQLSG
jgi:hypothetical protein